jgi:hypothetical protein
VRLHATTTVVSHGTSGPNCGCGGSHSPSAPLARVDAKDGTAAEQKDEADAYLDGQRVLREAVHVGGSELAREGGGFGGGFGGGIGGGFGGG